MQLKSIMLSLGVGILAALFIGFLIDAIYPSPKFEDFCKQGFETSKPSVVNQEKCNFTYNQEMRKECVQNNGMVSEEYDQYGCVISESCDYCQKEYQSVSEKYNLKLFYITAPIGLILIILGLYLPATIDAIAGGVLLGGILTMIQVTARVFGDLGKWPRVILLGLELVLVIWIGIKKVREVVIKKK